MLSFASAQFDGWVSALLWPLTRILALLATAPVLSSAGVPVRLRLGLGLALTLVIAPALGPMPAVAAASGEGLLILAQQVLIGVGMGFSMRVVFAAVDVAGELSGLQMGLGFASLYDPVRGATNPVLAVLLGMMLSLVFLSINEHLMIIAMLARSFEILPISSLPIRSDALMGVVLLGTKMFAMALFLSLPLLVALVLANLALGVLSRAAPQLNLFAIGFPATLGIGLVLMLLILPYYLKPFDQLALDAMDAADRYLKAALR